MGWGKKAPAAKPAATGAKQPVISSFFSKPPASTVNAPPASQAGAAAAEEADDDVVLVQSPAKKPRLEPTAPAPVPSSTPELHERFVDKLSSAALFQRGPSTATAREDVLTVNSPLYGRDAGPAGPYTPLERQILALKRAHPGVLLMIECGYKWKFYAEDAQTAADVLHIVAFNDRNFRSAGGPTHRGDVYVRRLCEAGHKVGVVRQTETAALKAASDNRSKLFERKLVQVYTRATLSACSVLDSGSDGVLISGSTSYLITIVEEAKPAVSGKGTHIALLAVEPSTGDVRYAAFHDTGLRATLEGYLLTLPAGEVLLACNKGMSLSPPTEKLIAGLYGVHETGPAACTRLERADISAWTSAATALVTITDNFIDPKDTENMLAVFKLPPLVIIALAAALVHLKGFNLTAVLQRAASFRSLETDTHMTLPPNALRQLDVLSAAGSSDGQGSLIWLLDHTVTPGGKRALHRWVSQPLRNADAINERLDAVAALRNEDGGLRATLKKLPDVERCLTRALHRTVMPGEFVNGLTALIDASTRMRALSSDVDDARPALLSRLLSNVADPAVSAEATSLLACMDTAAARASPPDMGRLFRTADDAAGRPAALTFPAVDAARGAIRSAEEQLGEQLSVLRKQLRVPSLQYVKVAEVEYLIELPETLPVPKGWLKHSQLKTRKICRWQVPEVTALVNALERGREELQIAASAAWSTFLTRVSASYATLRAASDALSQLDALQSLALVSTNDGYCRPQMLDQAPHARLEITAGRHPMLDALLNGAYVPNDAALSNDPAGTKPRSIIITGPNMGGKSSYVRSVALITLMAHIGCFVPASAATLSVCDGVYTRMGAADSLATGSSTFLEEMSEASAILRHATSRSLVIIDELGRGTSTEDGLAIAHATLRHIVTDLLPLTLFVTHFPSLAHDMSTSLAPAVATAFVSYQGVGDVDATARDASVTFMYKLTPGVASRAFGINVARMAGVPTSVLTFAAAKAEDVELKEQHPTAALTDVEVAALKAGLHETDR